METPDSKSGAANQRPQYHYFYGSIDDQSQVNRRENAVSVPTDQDSLVGESLLPTDNEQDDDRSKIAKQDFQQIVMSNVNGVRPIDSSRSGQSDKNTQGRVELSHAVSSGGSGTVRRPSL
ncbi:predicted protein [Phaeodactylum tricornutum CCAP 1055/1]|uniref:Uncharacterized protein n=1 Tax=Phaeodactylum tricornutum (strain CCAP 1055/1) TaxID=556484 RepID=B7G210_PHATC|nr:predicted protein [Phaeodactylum tricornutum CCAP 1055/1]EEC47218.1 predicted protein [Phaeodactylum tricornutum CCAP 1055/1]|eukprot:XP_002181295.1 predicted protein [Phaeodactylum tricornutum CCAP 1055/1]